MSAARFARAPAPAIIFVANDDHAAPATPPAPPPPTRSALPVALREALTLLVVLAVFGGFIALLVALAAPVRP